MTNQSCQLSLLASLQPDATCGVPRLSHNDHPQPSVASLSIVERPGDDGSAPAGTTKAPRRRAIPSAENREARAQAGQSRLADRSQSAQLPFLVLNHELEVIASNQGDGGMTELAEKLAIATDEVRARIERTLQGGDRGPHRLEWEDRDGQHRSLMLTAVGPDADRRVVPHFILIVDVTDQAKTVQELADLVEEQKLMLMETRHRMANGLQIIASILRIKTHLCPSTDVREHLEDVHRRVLAIAALEEQLGATAESGPNWVKPYLSAVCDRLSGSLIDPATGVELRVVATDLQMRPDTIVGIGLVVTELVINAVKHAFGGGRGGTIVVMLTGERDSWTLSVTDSGAGCRSDTLQSSSGLGTRIIRALARRLNAQLDISPNAPSGLRVALTHPRRPAAAFHKPT